MVSQQHKRRCLVVDDEEPILDFLQRTLAGDFEVVRAGSAEEALGLLERDRFAFIITDHRMPGLSGVELLARARAIDSSMVRLMLTAFDDVPEVLHARRMGIAAAVLVKPASPVVICEAVKRWLAYVDRGGSVEQEHDQLGEAPGGANAISPPAGGRRA